MRERERERESAREWIYIHSAWLIVSSINE
jgi:hypothetical protein